jgi:hypothetical protein
MTDEQLFADSYSFTEMAKLLDIAPKTLRNRISAGKDHPPVEPGNRFNKAKYRAWAEKRTRHEIKSA